MKQIHPLAYNTNNPSLLNIIPKTSIRTVKGSQHKGRGAHRSASSFIVLTRVRSPFFICR